MKKEHELLKDINQYFSDILDRALDKALEKLGKIPTTEEEREITRAEFLNAKKSAAFIGDAMPTFYKRISKGEIRKYGSGRRVFCKRSELLEWLNQTSPSTKELQEDTIRKMAERRLKK